MLSSILSSHINEIVIPLTIDLLKHKLSKFIASLIDFMNHDVSLSNTMATTEKIHSILEAYNNRANTEIDYE